MTQLWHKNRTGYFGKIYKPILCCQTLEGFPQIKSLYFKGHLTRRAVPCIFGRREAKRGNSFNWISHRLLQSPNSTQKSCWQSASVWPLGWSHNGSGLKFQVLELILHEPLLILHVPLLILHEPLMTPVTGGYCDKYRSIGQVNSRYRSASYLQLRLISGVTTRPYISGPFPLMPPITNHPWISTMINTKPKHGGFQ